MPTPILTLALVLGASPGAAAAAPPLASLDVGVTGLRSGKGFVRVCVTAEPKHFPNCDGDPHARHLSVPADRATDLRFDDLPAGAYAVALFHDENGNGRLDTRFGIPTEGFGFSNNPRLWFGPPGFAQARIALADRPVQTVVKLRYLF